MTKKKIYDILLLALVITIFVGCMTGMGFEVFDCWKNIDMFFEHYGFYNGMLMTFAPVFLISLMLLMIVQIIAILQDFKIIKIKKFEKALCIIREIVFIVAIVSVSFTAAGIFQGI